MLQTQRPPAVSIPPSCLEALPFFFLPSNAATSDGESVLEILSKKSKTKIQNLSLPLFSHCSEKWKSNDEMNEREA